jgi:hypothetical protein
VVNADFVGFSTADFSAAAPSLPLLHPLKIRNGMSKEIHKDLLIESSFSPKIYAS